MAGKKKPLDGTPTKVLLDEVQRYVTKGWEGVNKIRAGTPQWMKGASLLSYVQRLHDQVEVLYPAAHSDAQSRADVIAAGTETNEETGGPTQWPNEN